VSLDLRLPGLVLIPVVLALVSVLILFADLAPVIGRR
jgi:hypothetical protein